MQRLTATLCLLVLTCISCQKTQQKVDQFAQWIGIKAKPDAEKEAAQTANSTAPLTAEQQALENQVLNSAVFEVVQPSPAAPSPAVTAPATPAFELNKASIVAVLGYHDFKERGGTPMIISAGKFREQMKAIKESKIPVIPLNDVLVWRQGKKNIPEEAIVITMDDGWEGVYTHAYPVLKEYGFPFTIYLYQKYINIGGRSLSWTQIREMMNHGCEVGSHSISHQSLRDSKGRTPEQQLAWLLSELKDSKTFLEQNLGTPMATFAYPFGIFDEATMDLGLKVGYQALVTVNNQKVTWDSPMGKLGRYIIHGENDANFKLATSFRGRGDVASQQVMAADSKNAEGQPLLQLSPEPETTIHERQPTIRADLSRMGEVLADSVHLRISGLGQVPATWDASTQTLSYTLPHRLRQPECAVTLSFKPKADQPEKLVNWRFKVDLASSYKPQR
jgi:peptidoglycan/xylan/chitin deacetylase (PgdA/CDA1 family)